jgi:hypothetical protein
MVNYTLKKKGRANKKKRRGEQIRKDLPRVMEARGESGLAHGAILESAWRPVTSSLVPVERAIKNADRTGEHPVSGLGEKMVYEL